MLRTVTKKLRLVWLTLPLIAGCAQHAAPSKTKNGNRPQSVSGVTYPLHTAIITTTFWVGEIFKSNLSDGSQVCSTYDSQWAFHWSGGVNQGTNPPNAAGCPNSIVGGCDGHFDANGACATEPRSANNGYFPSQGNPSENPFYLDLPFDDVHDATAFASRCDTIPWASAIDATGARCGDQSFSYMKNRWVKITHVGANGPKTCYGQIEDAGPSHDDLYHDAAYVFGSDDARPIQHDVGPDAGMDVSPALNGCLELADLDGASDQVDWQFVDDADVPALADDGSPAPWQIVVTTSQVQ